MKLFIATLSTETNTFSNMPTGLSGFDAYYLRHGTATQDPPNLMTEALHLWRERGERLGWTVIESLAAIAEPAGRTVASCYDQLSAEILSDLEAAGGADIILLQLHGAMVAEHIDDCEGDLTRRARALYPDATIGVALDLHCHLTQEMLDAADIMITFKEYPHDDATPRAAELFDLAHRTKLGEIHPVMETFDCQMIELYLTKAGAMSRFVDEMTAEESKAGILSVSLAHGFPWGDVADVGARMLVVADRDAALACTVAERLGRKFYDLRHDVISTTYTLSDAFDKAVSFNGHPVVLADMGDNSGGGAPGDSTFVLKEVLDRNLSNVATGIYWDPMSVQMCCDIGEGAELTLRIGGKTGKDSGDPVDLNAKVMRIASGLGQHLGLGLEPLGTMVWLRTGDEVDIVINDLRTQVYHPEAFEQLGIKLAEKSLVTVKSLFHFYGPFSEISPCVIQMATPGGTSPSFGDIPFTKRDANYWPRVEDPFGTAP